MSPVSKPRKKKPRTRRVPAQGRGRTQTTDPAVEAPRRYTPPKVTRFRPTWHRVTGGILLTVGLAIVVLNYLEELELNAMPGPHSEGYFLLGIAVAAWSTWWFGWFDRPA